MKRELFLGRVRRALGRALGDPLAPAPEVAAAALVAPSVAGVAGEALLQHFIHCSEALGAPVRRASDEEGAVALAASWLREVGDSAVADASPLAQRVLLASGLPEAPLASANLGVCSAFRAVAETGTVVMHSRQGRLAALLPPQQLVLVHAESVLPGLTELYRVIAADPHPAAALVQVSGPSRTADIEMTLVTGVHGPGAVWVVLIG